MRSLSTGVITSIIVAIVVIGLFILWLWAYPQYRVWQQGLAGQAKLREAEYSRRVQVLEAQARLDSEKLNAQSEVVRAEGVAKSNEIISTSIDEQYIRYLWVKTLDGSQSQIIYIPTEAGLPITEAGRAPSVVTQPNN
jgi:predicted Holliday junction resolvase-like endonuclease